jgi:L-threonylcarbamoyladenylate synthase
MKLTLRLPVDPLALESTNFHASIARAAEILRAGGTVAFPTETVYGLGANAFDAAAVAGIFEAKQRPAWDPLIVHVSSLEMLNRVVADLCDNAQRLAEVFWPGPLTMLLPRGALVPDAVTAGRALVGVRMPSHPVAMALIEAAGVPVAAPSANSFGRISPTTAQHVAEDLEGRIDAILDGGETLHGLESTVIEPRADRSIIYRPGVVTAQQVRAVCTGTVEYYEPVIEMSAPESLPSPGVALRHYAPRARLQLVEGTGEEQQAALREAVLMAEQAGERVGVMLPESFQMALIGCAAHVYRWGRWEDKEELAQRLFAGLRQLDGDGSTLIICPLPEAGGIGRAICDRLRKAARTDD